MSSFEQRLRALTPATLEGIFEAELEGREEQILELRVNP